MRAGSRSGRFAASAEAKKQQEHPVMYFRIDGRLYTVASDGLLKTLRQSGTIQGRGVVGIADREHRFSRSRDVENVDLDDRIDKPWEEGKGVAKGGRICDFD